MKKKTETAQLNSNISEQREQEECIDEMHGEKPLSPITVRAQKSSYSSGVAESGLRELIEKNIKWSQVVYEQNRRISRRLAMMVVGNYLRLLLIIVPIILGIIYLPPIFEEFFSQYQQLFGQESGINVSSDLLRDAVELFGR